jgi:integrase/recombinase XerD
VNINQRPTDLDDLSAAFMEKVAKDGVFGDTVIVQFRHLLAGLRDYAIMGFGSIDLSQLSPSFLQDYVNIRMGKDGLGPIRKKSIIRSMARFDFYCRTGEILYQPNAKRTKARVNSSPLRQALTSTDKDKSIAHDSNGALRPKRRPVDLSFPAEPSKNIAAFIAHLATFTNFLLEEQGASPCTVKIYRNAVRGLIKFLVTKGLNITPRSVDKLLYLEFQSYAKKEWRYAPSVIVSLYTGNRAFFRYLLSINQIQRSPFEFIRTPKYARGLPRPLTEEGLIRLLEAPDLSDPLEFRDMVAMELMAGSGLRISECFSLKRRDLVLRGTKLGPQVTVMGKGRKERVVPLTLASVQALDRWLPSIGEPDAWVFPSAKKRNNPLQAATFEVRFKIYLKRAELPSNTTPHALRHTFASLMLENDADIRIIQIMLGHASLKSTTTYTQVTEKKSHETHRRCHPRNRVSAEPAPRSLPSDQQEKPYQLELLENISTQS